MSVSFITATALVLCGVVGLTSQNQYFSYYWNPNVFVGMVPSNERVQFRDGQIDTGWRL